MRLPNPWMILGAIFAASLLYFYAHHVGYVKRDEEMQLEIAKKNEESRQKEQKLTEELNTTASKLLEVNNVVTQKQSALDSAIRAGRVRISAPSCVQTTANPSSTATDTKAGSQPDRATDQPSDAERATLQAIAEIVAQGDRNTAALNACIDAYESARNILNDSKR